MSGAMAAKAEPLRLKTERPRSAHHRTPRAGSIGSYAEGFGQQGFKNHGYLLGMLLYQKPRYSTSTYGCSASSSNKNTRLYESVLDSWHGGSR